MVDLDGPELSRMRNIHYMMAKAWYSGSDGGGIRTIEIIETILCKWIHR